MMIYNGFYFWGIQLFTLIILFFMFLLIKVIAGYFCAIKSRIDNIERMTEKLDAAKISCSMIRFPAPQTLEDTDTKKGV